MCYKPDDSSNVQGVRLEFAAMREASNLCDKLNTKAQMGRLEKGKRII